MAAGHLPLTLEQGATLVKRLAWGLKGAAPYDLSASEAKLQVRRNAKTPVLAELSTDDGSIVLADGAAGWNIELTFQADLLDDSVTGECRYDLKVYQTGGVERRVVEGPVVIEPAITKDA